MASTRRQVQRSRLTPEGVGVAPSKLISTSPGTRTRNDGETQTFSAMGRSLRVQKREERRSGKGNSGSLGYLNSGHESVSSPKLPRKSRQPSLSRPSLRIHRPPAQKSRSTSTEISDIAPEIVVWTDRSDPPVDADETNSVGGDSVSTPTANQIPHVPPAPSTNLLKVSGPEQHQDSMASPMSIASDQSDLSSVPSNLSSRATTPVDSDTQREVVAASDVPLGSAPVISSTPTAVSLQTASIDPPLDVAVGESPTHTEPKELEQEEASEPIPPILSPLPTPDSVDDPVEAPAEPAREDSTMAIQDPGSPHSVSQPPPSPMLAAQPEGSMASPSPLTSAEASHSTPTPTSSSASVSGLAKTMPTSPSESQRETPRCILNVRPKSSIPPASELSSFDYASQCIEAAENSRLPPYTLHAEEYAMLKDHISYGQVTTYLNIRNGILRLWMQNPRLAVTRAEAVGCASARWADVASACFDWLVRGGYINYGCLEIPHSENAVGSGVEKRKQKTIVVIGAGMAGLGCARQLEGLCKQYEDSFREMGEEIPKVVVLEGRGRVGGRVYSRPFQGEEPQQPFAGERCTSEIGGMIITGFIGNPLNVLVRGQLGLPYHALNPKTTIYDSDGCPVKEAIDVRAEKLYNDCLDRVSQFKFKTQPAKMIEGNKELMTLGKDAAGGDNQKTIGQAEEEVAALSAIPVWEQNVQGPVSMVPVASDNVTGRVQSQPGIPASKPAAETVKSFGWELKPGVTEADNINLTIPASNPGATLGSVLESGFEQYKNLVRLTAQDFRLINWHVANLEYSNATNMHNLSLPGWDIDAGNEWSGKHTMIVGGYQRVPRGLLYCPTKLDVRMKSPVRNISYQTDGTSGPATITCQDGSTIDADYVVSTIPLGVLKHGDVEFDPPLPDWKTEAIGRLGWGVLNKVILRYKEPFWDTSRHIWGALRNSTNRHSVTQSEYRSQRGRFFQFLDVTATTGAPCLVALMAGDAALDTEMQSVEELRGEATQLLQTIFGDWKVPQPVDVVVTRWGQDPFARGSYSSAGPNMKTEDYNYMAKPIGNLYFAGEHTIGTHPATVHGAYMSGLRAASEILTSMIGEIKIPLPLIIPKGLQGVKRKLPDAPLDPNELYNEEVEKHIVGKIGPQPTAPERVVSNAYRLYMHANQHAARARYQADIRPGKRKGKAGPNDIRNMVSRMWKEAPPEDKKPFEDRVAQEKAAYAVRYAEWKEAFGRWNNEAVKIRSVYEKEHPSSGTGKDVDGPLQKQRRTKHVSYRENDSDDDL